MDPKAWRGLGLKLPLDLEGQGYVSDLLADSSGQMLSLLWLSFLLYKWLCGSFPL